jgi:hypothetical protein
MGLALYNTARFGDPLEFGHRFQVGSIADNYVSLRYFIHNLTVYYLTPPSAGWFFPFFSPGLEGARPPGYIGVEYADGQWWFLPWLVVLPVLGGIFWRRLRCVQPLAVIVGVIALWFAANFALVASVSARANRYMLDFHPALVLLVGLALLAWSGRGGGWRFAVGAGAVSVITAAFVNVMESLQVHEFFRQGNPAKYAAIERVANRLVWPLHRVTSPALGPIEWVVTFPNVPAGTREPLVCTSAPMLTNTLSFFTLGPGRARLEFDHESHGGARGPEFTFEPGRPYDLKIWLGSLLPPVGHPWFDGVAPALVQQQKQTVMVQLDGRTVFVSSAIPHDASPGQVRLGRSVVQYSDAQPKFSGRIGQVHRGAGRPPLPGPAAPEEPLTYALEMLLPRDRFGLAEPLMATGRWGKGDVVLIEYSSPTSVRLGHDQLGGGIEWSEPLPVDYLAPLKLEISFETPATADRLAAVDRAGLRPVIHRGGQTVFAGKNVLHTFDPAQVSVGCNTAGASASRLYFAGTILAWEFVGDRVQRAVGGGVGDPDTCVEFVPPRALSATVAEPLLAYRNTAGDRAVLALRSAGPGLMQLGWREAATAVWSESFRATPGANVRLEVRRRAEATAGALATDGISAGAFFRGRAEIRWNGEPVFQPRLAFFDSPIAATAGWSSPSGVRGDLAPHFTGAIRVVEARSPPTATLPPYGPRTVRVSVRFPANRIGLSEPLLTSGRTGAADSVYVHYLAGGRISLGFDHWGAGGPVSAPLAVDYAQAHALEVTLGDGAWEQGGAGLLRVRLDGRRVIESRAQFHPARAGEIVLGENPVGLSTSVPEFSGMLNSLE